MLTVEKVTAGYGDTLVLREVDLHVDDGSVVALLGPNGAGKTTLMRVASGMLHQQAGHVRLDGEDLAHEAPHRRLARGMCHVPEGRAVFPALTVRENLTLFASQDHGAAIDKAVGAFPVLGQRINQRAGSLSGGEQQMLALARVYLAEARLILLDEVSMGLAPKVVDDIFAFIAALAASGVALLLVEQYVSKALELADFVYVMKKGRIALHAAAGEIDRDELVSRYLGSDPGKGSAHAAVR